MASDPNNVGENGRAWVMTGHGTGSLNRLPATLGLGDGWGNGPYTMTEMHAVEGQYVLLLPRTVEGPSMKAAVDPATWLFTPDSGGPPRPACGDNAQRYWCQLVVSEAGKVTVTGYANGGPPTTTSIHIWVPNSTIKLHLSRDSVASGDTVMVTTEIINAQSSQIYGYMYDAPQWVTGSCVTDYGAGLASCFIVPTGPGIITVYTNVDGRTLTASGTLKVTEAQDQTPLSISIIKAEGPNPNKSFTFAAAERKITLKAELTPANAVADVKWEVIDAPDDNVSAIPPTEVLTGLETSFMLPKHQRSRWPQDHPGGLDRKTLRYKVTAIATRDGQSVRSAPVIVSQDLVDTIREEYYEFGLTALGRHIPGRGEFTASPPVQVGANNGDYSLAVLEPRFMRQLAVLKSDWPGRWQLNTIYRNPNHNLNKHIPTSNRSKPSIVSWHMWGCAADLQTFPPDGSAAQVEFWEELTSQAVEMGFDIESLAQAGKGHVHVELDCP